jgi:integrase
MHQAPFKGWKDELQTIININNAKRANGKIASGKTQADRATLLFNCFKELRKRGYAVSPHNLKPRHIQILCDWMISSTEYDGSPKRVATPATIQTYIMHLRAFARWIGKDGMIGPASDYIADKTKFERTYAAVEEKTWTAKGIDVAQKVSEVKMDNYYVWAQLLLVQAFGLRLKEAVSIRPYMNAIEGSLHIIKNSKGGKNRIIPIETNFQVFVINTVKQFVGKTSLELRDPKLSLAQNMKKFSNTMTKHGLTKKNLGATLHWLRAEYVIDYMRSEGLVPLVSGGELGQLPNDEEMQIRLQASQRLGHNRVGITTAYSGAFTKTGKIRAEKASQQQASRNPKEGNSNGDDEPEAELVE